MSAARFDWPASISLDGSDWEAHGYLGDEWRFREGHTPHGRERDWLLATVPGSVLEDLRACGAVADPYVGRNSLLSEWVPERTWLYRRRFTLPGRDLPPRIQLRLEGIDYAGDVFLNGESLGRHEGTFVPAAWEVRDLLRPGGENLLAVVLEPAPPSEPQVGRSDRVHVHKPRMSYGWDFCPRMVHVGIWDSVLLRASGALRIDDVWVRAEPRGDTAARVRVAVAVDGEAPGTVDVEIAHEDRRLAAARSALLAGRADVVIELADAPRWWPNRPGPPGWLLTAVIRVRAGRRLSDERIVRFGVRSVELAPNEGAPVDALPYTLEVNGRRTPIRGWNWVALDACYGPRRPERLARLLDLAQRAGVNLLRVWGGGLIERDDFYDGCDERGILVWQEFSQSSSGIGSVPSTDPEFVERMRREAEQIVPRRRNHPSLAIWGGGNELTADDGSPVDDRHPVIGALAEVVGRLDPGRAWLPSSPSGRAHDVHGPWEHQGPVEHYRLHNAGTSLLHSEFGVEGMANAMTLRAAVPEADRWPPDRSNPMYAHLGAWWNNAPSVIEWFGGEAFREDLEALELDARLDVLRRCSQLLQADGLRYAVESSRRRWPRSAGTLPWQLNEPFPNAWCTSVIDYHGRPKPAFWAVAEAYRPLVVGTILERQALCGASSVTVRPWLLSEEGPAVGRLAVRLHGADGEIVARDERPIHGRDALIGEPMKLPLEGTAQDGEAAFLLLDILLLDSAGATIADRRFLLSRTADLAPLRAVSTTRLEIARVADGLAIRNAGSRVAIGVEVADERPAGAPGWPSLSAGWFHLLPAEERLVTVEWPPATPRPERQLVISAWNAPPVSA